VATVHRASTTDDVEELRRVVAYLADVARELPVVLPLHPRTRAAVAAAGVELAGLVVLAPISYLAMARLLVSASLVLTDSGGLQKEAYFHRVPCVTLRSTTEWVETVASGWNRLWSEPSWREPRVEIAEYGDGRAAARIADLVAGRLGAT
jgi:UDP-GlcNAc3NAcA epimerase